MERPELQTLLDASVLYPRESLFKGLTTTRFALFLWGELSPEDRKQAVALLIKAHRNLGRRIQRAKVEKLDALIEHCNRILAREGLLAAEYPDFHPHGAGLKDILLRSIMARWNRDSRPGATVTLEEIAQKFSAAVREYISSAPNQS